MTNVFLLDIETEDGHFYSVYSSFAKAETMANQYMEDNRTSDASVTFDLWINETNFEESIDITELTVDDPELGVL
jgi:hypothetical protein